MLLFLYKKKKFKSDVMTYAGIMCCYEHLITKYPYVSCNEGPYKQCTYCSVSIAFFRTMFISGVIYGLCGHCLVFVMFKCFISFVISGLCMCYSLIP